MLSKTNQLRGQSDLQMMIREVAQTKKKEIKRTPIFLFRALVRTVINNLKWLKGEVGTQETKTKFTTETKGLLRKEIEERNAEDKILIRRLIGNLKCFLRYPANVRENLATTATFTYFGPGRKLVSEGHPSVAMYFIISGKANVSKMTFDPGVREDRSINVDVMEAGDSFGEINILHDEPWPTTVTSLTDIEILKVERGDFQRILQVFLGEQKRLVTEALNSLAYFKDWNQRTIVECCILSRIENYDKDELILGDDFGNPRNAYFIISGQCLVLYHLQIEIVDRLRNELKIVPEVLPPRMSAAHLKFLRISPSTVSTLSNLIGEEKAHSLVTTISRKLSTVSGCEKFETVELESHFMQIGILFPGQCFGIGESLSNKFFLSNTTPSTVLSIPRHFLNLHNRANIWPRMMAFFNRAYPTQKIIFEKFLSDRKWKKSREDFLSNISSNNKGKPFTGITAGDTPYHLRLTEDITNPIFNRVRKTLRKVKIVTEE